MMRLRGYFFCAAALLGLAPAPARAQCTGVNHVVWPAVNPDWDFCWQRPSVSSLANGEGIRISSVKYRGVTILRDAHIPVLNVQYNAGGCGGSVLCYRDWFDQERRFDCAPSPSAGYCTATTTPATTVCDHPGTDAGAFSGVAVIDQGTSLKLISQAQAGWYRYIATWEFFPDGRIIPGMDITAINNSCVAFTHRHHAYWRLDFDLNGAAANSIERVTPGGTQPVASESMFTDPGDQRTFWRVSAAGSPVRVDVMRTPEDGNAFGDSFARGDGWLLAYRATELDDGPHNQSQCPADLSNYLNSENVSGADLVLWVHSGNEHKGEAGGLCTDCSKFGPLIRVNLTGALSSSVVSAPPACAGQPVSLTAAFTPVTATGSVQFLDGNASLGTAPISSGSAVLSLNLPGAGLHSIVAVYQGDAAVLGNKSAPYDLSVNTAPTEALNLRLAGAAPTQLTWTAPVSTGGGTLSYDVLRSQNAGDFLAAGCLAANLPGTTAADPATGSAFYLVRAKTDCGGTLGTDSTGTPIPGVNCP